MFPLAGKQVSSSRQAPCDHGALDLEFSSEKIISSDSTDILRPLSLFRGFPVLEIECEFERTSIYVSGGNIIKRLVVVIQFFFRITYVTLGKLKTPLEYNIHGSVHRESMSITGQQDATMYTLLYFCKLLYMFRVVTPPIIRSTYNCNCSIWHWSNFGKCSV
jgi:hypothetical protein